MLKKKNRCSTLFLLEKKTDMADFCFFRKPRCLFRQLKDCFSNTARFWASRSRFSPHRFLFFRLAKCGTLIFFLQLANYACFKTNPHEECGFLCTSQVACQVGFCQTNRVIHTSFQHINYWRISGLNPAAQSRRIADNWSGVRKMYISNLSGNKTW